MDCQSNNTLNVELIVALVASASTIITVFLTNYFSSRNELKMKSRDLKESKYIGFLKLIIDARGKFKDDENLQITKELSETLQMIYLIGNDEVINSTKAFIDIFKDSNAAKNQNILYSNMIKAMRKDLYGKRKVFNHPKELELMLFQ